MPVLPDLLLNCFRDVRGALCRRSARRGSRRRAAFSPEQLSNVPRLDKFYSSPASQRRCGLKSALRSFGRLIEWNGPTIAGGLKLKFMRPDAIGDMGQLR